MPWDIEAQRTCHVPKEAHSIRVAQLYLQSKEKSHPTSSSNEKEQTKTSTMPPKKRSSSKGGKKKKGTKKGKEKVVAGLSELDLALPLIPSAQAQVVQSACAASDGRTLMRMVDHYNGDAYLKEVDCNGSSPLHLAVRNNDIPLTKKLLSYEAIDVNKLEMRGMGGYTALHLACSQGTTVIIEALLKQGADIHLKADSALGERPLHTCCKHGHLAAARLLIAAGVDTDLRDNFGHNGSYWATQRGFVHMITELELPVAKAATAAEFFKIMQEKLRGKFVLPSLTRGKKGGGKGKSKSKSPGKKKK